MPRGRTAPLSRRVMLRAAVLGSLGVAGTVLAGCAGTEGTSGQAPGTGSGGDARAGTSELFPQGSRKPAPSVSGELLDGARFDLASWSGSMVVVNFWGSWCAPCRLEAPELQAVHQATQDLGVRFLGVDLRDERDAAKAFHVAFGVTYPSLFDPAGRVALAFRDVPPNVIPATVILDRQHRIAAVFRKALLRPELEPPVRQIGAEP